MKKFAKLGLVTILSMAFALPVAAKTDTKAKAKTASTATAKKSNTKVAEKASTPKTTAKPSTAASKKADAKKTVEKTSSKTAKNSKATEKKAKIAAKESRAKVVKTSYSRPTTTTKANTTTASKAATPVATGSVARQYGLAGTYDPVGLRASVALVVDQNSWTTLYEKNVSTSLPIASITKLMTAMVVLDAGLDMNEYITITNEDAAHYRSSRLTVGTSLPRKDVMLLALMSSENRAAYALGRTYPGGLGAFIQAMNAKAMMLGMTSATFVDPSGLSSSNRASAMDLAKMVNAATQYKTIRELSTNDNAYVYTADGQYKTYTNSNRLISRNMGWDIGLQKTGTLRAAGKCLVLQTRINGTPKIMVFLDSSSADSRVSDAVKLKDWIEAKGYNNTAALK